MRPFHAPLAVLLVFAMGAHGEDWPQWRGPRRDGKSVETGLLKSWPAGGPRRVWKISGLGKGYSTVSVSQGRIFTQGQQGGRQFIIALEESSGRKLWQTPHGPVFEERRGDGPRGVPTVEGDRLWALSAMGVLSCLDSASGRSLWSVNVVEQFGGAVPHWGISESPLIDGDHVIVTPGGPGASVVALNKRTGKPVWKSQSDRAAYSSPVVVESGGLRQILAFTSKGAIGLRASNGELLWRYDRVANRTANIATPIYSNGHAFYSSDYGTGAALLKLTPDGGSVRASEVYFTREMRNHYSTCVLVGDYLYGYSSMILTAMKFMTGETAWRHRSVGKGSLIYADGNLYALGEAGVLGLVEATPEGYKEKSRFSIEKGAYPLWSPPVIANGRLYVRDQDSLYAFDIKAR